MGKLGDNPGKRLAAVVVAVAMLFTMLFTLVACAPTPAPEPTLVPVPEPTPAPVTGKSVTIDLTAERITFDKTIITVPANAEVTVVFSNKDSIPHNLAVYETRAAAREIFVGEVFSGPKTVTYRFRAPVTPGTYFFRCDVHPSKMTGDFIVTASSP